MHDVIARLRTRSGIQVVDLASAWEIRVPKPGGMVFVVTVPHDVTELFVDVRQPPTDQVIWSNWCDYYVLPGVIDTEAEARALLARDTEDLVERLLASPVRLVEHRTTVFRRRRQRAEWWTGDEWREVDFGVL